jgi:hypothetical protein
MDSLSRITFISLIHACTCKRVGECSGITLLKSTSEALQDSQCASPCYYQRLPDTRYIKHIYNIAILGNGLFFTSSNAITFFLLSGSECKILCLAICKSRGILLTIAAAASLILGRAPADTSGWSLGPTDLDRRNGSSLMILAL